MDDATTLTPPVRARRFTIDEFRQMLESGLLAPEEGLVELAGGQVIVAPSEGPRHVSAGRRLLRLWLPRIMSDPALDARVALYSPGTVALADTGSVRSPDVLLCPPGIFEGGRWPDTRECLIAIENSDSNLRYDENVKRGEYARAGLPELWVVRLEHKDVRVCRGPREDGSWTEADLHSGNEVIAPAAAPELAIAVAALFAD